VVLVVSVQALCLEARSEVHRYGDGQQWMACICAGIRAIPIGCCDGEELLAQVLSSHMRHRFSVISVHQDSLLGMTDRRRTSPSQLGFG